MRIFGLLVILGMIFSSSFSAFAGQNVFGWVEEGLLVPEKVSIKVKLDTGARTSSIDARNIQRFKKSGKEWVKYDVEVNDSDTGAKHKIAFERPIERLVKVRGAGGTDHRPIVRMKICVGTKVYDEEFSLNNRKKMLYPALLGRKAIEHLGLIDVRRTFTMEPNCS